jgi:hypothetical protein
MKQDELDGDPKFTITIGFGGKSSLLNEKQKAILKMEKNMWEFQKPHTKV